MAWASRCTKSLTGEPPFRGAPQMVLDQVLRDEPASPRRLNDRMPRDLETICLKAMAKEPDRRYQTAADMRDDLSAGWTASRSCAGPSPRWKEAGAGAVAGRARPRCSPRSRYCWWPLSASLRSAPGDWA